MFINLTATIQAERQKETCTEEGKGHQEGNVFTGI